MREETKMLRWQHALVGVWFSLGLVACGTVQMGRDFDLKAFESKIERGVTTKDQVRAWLDEPVAVGVNVVTGGRRFEEWSYYYGQGRLPSMEDARIKILQIKFDEQGIVRGYNWSGEAIK